MANGFDAVNIHVAPKELAAYCRRHQAILSEKQGLLADNEETGHAIYVTLCADDPSANYPRLNTFRYGKLLREDALCSAQEAEERYQQLIRWFLIPIDDAPEPSEDDAEGEEDPEDAAYERSDELYQSMLDHLSDVLQVPRGEVEEKYGDDIVYDCLDNLCGFLADSYGISVYYPVVEKDGAVTNITEYPYDPCI